MSTTIKTNLFKIPTIDTMSLHPSAFEHQGELSPNDFFRQQRRNFSCFSMNPSAQNSPRNNYSSDFKFQVYSESSSQIGMTPNNNNYNFFNALDKSNSNNNNNGMNYFQFLEFNAPIDLIPNNNLNNKDLLNAIVAQKRSESQMRDEDLSSQAPGAFYSSSAGVPDATTFSKKMKKNLVISKSSSGRMIQKSKDYDKNICRYISRLVVRMFCDKDEYAFDAVRVTGCHVADYNQAVRYFLDRIECFTGHIAFANFLTISQDEDAGVQKHQRIFQKFAKWFLRERAVRYILQGEAQDQLSYIRYKNDIMLYYIDQPEMWKSNKSMKKKRLVRKD